MVRRRFKAGLRNLFGLYQDLVDVWQVFDNSSLTAPRLIASGRSGEEPHILDVDAWRNLKELAK